MALMDGGKTSFLAGCYVALARVPVLTPPRTRA